jgi:hypothetical protein
MKLNFKIALIFSSIYTVVFLVEDVAAMFRYIPGSMDWRVATFIPWPILLLVFPAIVLWSHQYYFSKAEKRSFRDVLVISLFIILLGYCFHYLVNLASYELYFEERIPRQTETGILGLLNSFISDRPSFSPVRGLLISPFQTLKWSIFSGNPVDPFITIINEKIFCLALVLYFESLFYMFKRYQRNPWFAITPFLNNWTLIRIAKKPAWWNIPIYIPIIRYFFLYPINVRLSSEGGKSRAYALGMTLLPFYFYGNLYLSDSAQHNHAAEVLRTK